MLFADLKLIVFLIILRFYGFVPSVLLSHLQAICWFRALFLLSLVNLPQPTFFLPFHDPSAQS